MNDTIKQDDTDIKIPDVIRPRKRKTEEEIKFLLNKKMKSQEIDLTCYEKLDVIKDDVLEYVIKDDATEPPLPINHCCYCYEYIYVGSQLCRKLYCQYEFLDKESLFNMKINNLKVCPCYTDPNNEYYELYHGIIHNYLKNSNLLESSN
jgi:hypothetical protein